jgi:hypothetical protein
LIVYPVPTSFLASRPWFAGKASGKPSKARYDSTFSEGNQTTTHKISLTFSGLFLVTNDICGESILFNNAQNVFRRNVFPTLFFQAHIEWKSSNLFREMICFENNAPQSIENIAFSVRSSHTTV